MRRTSIASLTLFTAVACAPCAFADDAQPAAPPAPPAAAVIGDSDCYAAPSTCCPPRNPCRRGRLEVQAGVSLVRPEPEGRVTEPTALPDEAVWDSVDYDLALAGRIAYTHPLGDWDLNAAFTLWAWLDEEGSQSPARLTSNLGNTLYPTVEYDSDVRWWDLNLTATRPFHCTPCFTASWGGGLRYLRFDEESTFAWRGLPPDGELGADIQNGLLAAEFVAEGVWRIGSRWDFIARGSVFGGWLHVDGEATQQGLGVAVGDTESSDDRFGYGGELELGVRWHVSSCWTVTAGYGFLAMGEVARGFKGPDSGNFGPPADLGPILSEDWVTAHRIYIGLSFDL